MSWQDATEKLGGSVSQRNNVVETITRESRKIGRNERVTVKNIQNGEKEI